MTPIAISEGRFYPSVNKIFALLLQQVKQHTVPSPPLAVSTAFAESTRVSNPTRQPAPDASRSRKLHCLHRPCLTWQHRGWVCHVKDNCYALHDCLLAIGYSSLVETHLQKPATS
ncbi:hypothetical protein AMTRI_Chr11g155540 [Amborella trichopoda]